MVETKRFPNPLNESPKDPMEPIWYSLLDLAYAKGTFNPLTRCTAIRCLLESHIKETAMHFCLYHPVWSLQAPKVPDGSAIIPSRTFSQLSVCR